MFREEVAEHYRAKGYTIHEDVKVRGESGTVHRCDLVAQSPLGNLVIAFEDAGGFEGPEMNAVKRLARDIGATPVVAAQAIPPGVQRLAARQGVVLVDAETLQRVEEEPEEPEPDEPEYPPWPGTQDEEDDEEPTPWPRTARARPAAEGPMRTEDVDTVIDEWTERAHRPHPPKSTDPGFWTYPREGDPPMDGDAPVRQAASAEASGGQAFSWLGAKQTAPEQAAEPRPGAPVRTAPATTGPVLHAGTRPDAPGSAFTASQDLRFWHWLVLAVVFGATIGGVLFGLSALFG